MTPSPSKPNKLEEYEDKIKKLSAEFELFAHITSHDLRDPLRQAIINCEQIKENSSQVKLINETIDSIDEVLLRIAALREYSYMANYSKDTNTVDCNQVLQKAKDDLKEKIDKSKAKISSDNLPTINGSENHLIKLFTNLIDNAIKFKSTSAPQIDIKVKDQKTQWEFSFSDNGIGLEEVYKSLVFSLFQRLTPEIKDGSLGAGLAFCRKIVENHSGQIWFKSDGKNGTCFYFTVNK